MRQLHGFLRLEGLYGQRRTLHLLLWIAAIAYLLLSPTAYTVWFVTDGKPVYSSQPFPMQQTSNFRSHVEELYTLSDEQGTYQIRGWGFLDNTLPAEVYSRNLILTSHREYLVFETEFSRRVGVALHFSQENLEMAGFLSTISKYSLSPGTYNLWLSFTAEDGQKTYADTGFCIMRTPNQLTLFYGC